MNTEESTKPSGDDEILRGAGQIHKACVEEGLPWTKYQVQRFLRLGYIEADRVGVVFHMGRGKIRRLANGIRG